MKAFDLNDQIVRRYGIFSRSFSKIRAHDLEQKVSAEYESGRFWPDALLALNPRFKVGESVEKLAKQGILHELTAKIFRVNGRGIRFYHHQQQAIAKALSGENFIVTTGTGSGKSLCFFVPIVDRIMRARAKGEAPRTRAIIIYPMNALANSQLEEIGKFIGNANLPDDMKPVVRRFTGQESSQERQRIASNPPDILLTNFMMAELLLTRQDDVDRQVMDNARGLEFIVLDELHTYRGRQGSDVGVLVRRLQERCAPERPPVCIGTSATMASEGDDENRADAVARVASLLFGQPFGADAIIGETLQRATDPALSLQDVRPRLKSVLQAELSATLHNETLKRHPLAVWLELAIGLEDGHELKRAKPMAFSDVVERLAKDSGVDKETCAQRLQAFLTLTSVPENSRGGSSNEAFMAFKLHRLVSGAGEVYTTLKAPERSVLFDGQREDPNDPGTRLYPTRFCQNCGQEFHIVTRVQDTKGETIFIPRDIDDEPLKSDEIDETNTPGYLTPVAGPEDDDYVFGGNIDDYPEEWLEEHHSQPRLRSYRRKQAPQLVKIGSDGRENATGRAFWFLPGKFSFCPRCLDQPTPQARERNKLMGLTGEGRSSATTVLSITALEWMHAHNSNVPEYKRKVLGFTDNRQDAALQAGHFNDFVFNSVLRGALLRAVVDASESGLEASHFGSAVADALGFTGEDPRSDVLWMLKPDAGILFRQKAHTTLTDVLQYRVLNELRRGWRYTNPGLRDLDLVQLDFPELELLAADDGRSARLGHWWAECSVEKRQEVLRMLLEYFVDGMAIHNENLQRKDRLEDLARRSREQLQAPWVLDENEHLNLARVLILSPSSCRLRRADEELLLRAGPTSRLGRMLNRRSVWGRKMSGSEYLEVMERLIEMLEEEGYLFATTLGGMKGWRLASMALQLKPGEGLHRAAEEREAQEKGDRKGNPFFRQLYQDVCEELRHGTHMFAQLEGREHTAQVDQERRQWREWRFRYEEEDRRRLQEHTSELREAGEPTGFLPALFCTPTMELGVDISALNVVLLRNVPPTPANYAQRAGRAGRSGQGALILTYCAAQSPHDQYYFQRREQMVAGIVRPPMLDLSNEELVRAHLQAVWLAHTGLALPGRISEILDLQDKEHLPLKPEIRQAITDGALFERARQSMRNVLQRILAGLDNQPMWLADVEAFVEKVATEAPMRFDAAFDRWRELYRSAFRQLEEANRRSEIPGLPARERRQYAQIREQAELQIRLLEAEEIGENKLNADFYSYRYLATEGFLPGYNFPRLPLYAYIPGRERNGRFLQRPRFLAIAEFGPGSLIYHEGRAYRVVRAKLPADARTADGIGLNTHDMFICANCGAAHDMEMEKCHACGHSMAGARLVRSTLRIDSVEARPVERISANDEERVRQGFEIQTVFVWPRRSGRVHVQEAVCRLADRELLHLQYANSAEIRRINLGLRRRQDKTVLGFSIDPQTGYWVGNDHDRQREDTPDTTPSVRVVPVVRDHKNALLVRLPEPREIDSEVTVGLQYALLRGMEVAFSIEEGEILAEPLPTRDERRAILFYEATEGGAGVLGRLVDRPHALGEVARRALELMHFANIDEAVKAGDATLLQDAEDACVRGCYRCLLSYYNQPDHELIDRTHAALKQMLVDVARAEVVRLEADRAVSGISPWLDVFAEAGLPVPETEPVQFAGQEFPFVWREHLVAACSGRPGEAALAEAEGKGWQLIGLPSAPSTAGLPADIIELLKG